MTDIAIAPERATETVPLPNHGGLWTSYGIATLMYAAGMALTRPIFISDTLQYLGTASPGNAMFWDFGHLLWRPFLWLLLGNVHSSDRFLRLFQAFNILNSLSMAAGLVAVWLAIATVRLFTHRVAVIAISGVVLSFAQVVLTHSRGGCAYIFGFVAISAGLYTLLAAARIERPTCSRAVMAGFFLAIAFCLWFPYIFAVPGALSACVLFSENPRGRWYLVLNAALTCALLGVGTYFWVAIHLGILDVRSFVGWAQASSHGLSTSGVSRVFFGFARSFIALGENGDHGVAFKRFLLHDPYNPVRFWQMLGLPFWEIALFYAFVISVLRNLYTTPDGRRALQLLAITSLPVLVFAAVWAGTDLERYLPLFPALTLAIGLGLRQMRFPSVTSALAVAFVLALVVVNVKTLSRGTRERQLQELTSTVRTLNESLASDSLVLLPPIHPLQRIYWDFPEALPLAEHNLKLERLVDLDVSDTLLWRDRVCYQMRQRWKKQIPVVIESSLLQPRPPQNTSWVEGDDPRVGWRDINGFTSQLELGDRVGNTHFFVVPATARNIETIDRCLSR
jgi:hypothetical protein